MHFFSPEDWVKVRELGVKSAAQGLIYRWVKAHRALYNFRSEQAEKSSTLTPELRFWYGTRSRVLLALVLIEASLNDERLSRREISRRSHVSLPTVIENLEAAKDKGFIDDRDRLTSESEELIGEKILELISKEEFRLLAEAIRSYHLSKEVPVDPFSQ